VDEALTLDELCRWDPVVRALEQQPPAWEPGTHHAYHTLTYGWLVGEVLRRITSETPGTFFADDIAGPLGLRAWMGLPAAEQPNVAHVEPAPRLDGPIQEVIDGFVGPGTMAARTIEFGGALPLGLVTPDGGFNDPRVWAAEMPAGNLISDARSLARTYAATIGEVDGVRLLQPDTIAAATTVQTTSSAPFGIPPGLEDYDIVKSLGFDTPTAMNPMLGPSSFGHGGAGGSLSFADPDRGIAFSYVMNQMLTEIPGPPRAALLVDALRTSLRV
jgi:CubicO group peptidase (beta-lactamase class C family)